MYAYIFDSFLQERKYAHDVSQIENRLVTLGIQGRTEKLTILKNLQETAKQMIKRGATTLVVVGNDETVTKVLPFVIDAGVTLGIIPVGQPQMISRVLGIPSGLAACETISRRIIRHLDIGRANTAYFVFQLAAPASVSVDCGDYRISSLDEHGHITITNFSLDGSHSIPDDGAFEVVVAPGAERRGWKLQRQPQSVFRLTKAKLVSSGLPASITLDGHTIVKTPVAVTVDAGSLDVIVGKERGF